MRNECWVSLPSNWVLTMYDDIDGTELTEVISEYLKFTSERIAKLQDGAFYTYINRQFDELIDAGLDPKDFDLVIIHDYRNASTQLSLRAKGK